MTSYQNTTEFSTVVQWLETGEKHEQGTLMEELRTLQIKKPVSAIKAVEERSKWAPFGAAKKLGNAGISSILKEEILIETANPLETEDEIVIAKGLVKTKASIPRRNSAPKEAAAVGPIQAESSKTETS